jgi:hypothetical protein
MFSSNKSTSTMPASSAWNPILHTCFMIYKYWRIRKSSQSTRKEVTDQLNSLEQEVQKKGGDIHQDTTKRTTTYQLKLAIKNLRNQRQLAAEARQQHLTFQQETLVLEGKKQRAAAIATIQKTERRQKCFRNFHTYTKPPRSSGGLSNTISNNNDSTQQRLEEPNILAEALYQRNRKHFAQAHGTPFTIPPLSTALQFSGVSQAGREVLTGNIPTIPLTTESARAILRELTQVRPSLPHKISFNAMITGLSKWRESTTTSRSGKHLGIYISLVQYYRHTQQAIGCDNTLPRPPHSDIALQALKIQHFIINLAIAHTHTLLRWQVVHNFFIEKTPGNPTLGKLRVIHIYEADWNLILKYFISFTLTNKDCKENTVTKEQAGGRKGRCASDTATNTIRDLPTTTT